MLHPSYNDLMNAVNSEEGEHPVINSRYSIVIATSKRARQIIEDSGEEGRSLKNGKKPLSIAIDELSEGNIKILSEDDTLSD